MVLSRLKISVTSNRRIFAACSKNKIRNHSSEDRARPRKAAGADEESRLLGVRSHNEGQTTVGVDGNGGSSRLRFDGTICAGQFEQRGRHCLLPEGRLDGCHLRSMVGLSPRVTFVVMRSRQRRARWCCFGVTRLDVRWKRASTAVLLSQGLYLGPECLGLNSCRLRFLRGPAYGAVDVSAWSSCAFCEEHNSNPQMEAASKELQSSLQLE